MSHRAREGEKKCGRESLGVELEGPAVADADALELDDALEELAAPLRGPLRGRSGARPGRLAADGEGRLGRRHEYDVYDCDTTALGGGNIKVH
jgi:hypothetical protein